MWKGINKLIGYFFVAVVIISGITNSGLASQESTEKVRVFTRQIEFDYVNWTLQAIGRKLSQAALGGARYLNDNQQKAVMIRYLQMVDENNQLRSAVSAIYADPMEASPQITAAPFLQRQRSLKVEMDHIGLLAESVMQQQVAGVLAENSLSTLGQVIPPVEYHTTPLPYALIVSPRNVIRQDADISLLPDLTLDQIVALENHVEQSLNVSALVVPVGGIGVYPTMVMETSNLPWLAEVISHEWTHNFLTLRPLGVLYDQSPALRTINETTASISGNEVGDMVVSQFYPQYLPANEADQNSDTNAVPALPDEPLAFDYQTAMHETRVTADALLSEGKIIEAEHYMETRRLLFIQNGYSIRRLNQAYFAFYGAYADSPGGAAGEDPVGKAVRDLRAQSKDLSAFIRQISRVTSYDKLLEMVR